MNKKRLSIIAIAFAVASTITGCSVLSVSAESLNPGQHTNTALPNSYFLFKAQNDPIPKDWKTYINKEYGFNFRYPASFHAGKEYNVINTEGKTVVTGVHFSDSLSNISFELEYHLAPAGTELFAYALNKFRRTAQMYEKGSKIFKIAGTEALQLITKIILDGKGNKLSSPLKNINADIFDKRKTADIQLHFKAPVSDETAAQNFQLLLSSFKFN